jgi:hypothetical protein
MCDWGNTKPLNVTIPARLSSTGKDKQKIVDIDLCIFDLVKLLNENGFATIASCCGHGRRPGNIALRDGRELVIARDYDEGRMIDNLFPGISE